MSERLEEVVMDSAEKTASSSRGYTYGGPAFVGGILVGIGLGILLGDFAAWFLIGLGGGFILMALIAALGK
jgi:F0F1-type ATP synthase assembly protein I